MGCWTALTDTSLQVCSDSAHQVPNCFLTMLPQLRYDDPTLKVTELRPHLGRVPLDDEMTHRKATWHWQVKQTDVPLSYPLTVLVPAQVLISRP